MEDERELWAFAAERIARDGAACLAVIVACEGHVPNGPGAKLVAAGDGTTCGTIGGGPSEQRLCEEARAMVRASAMPATRRLTLRHDESGPGTSGMLCSGTQTFVLVRLTERDAPAVNTLLQAEEGTRPALLRLGVEGLAVEVDTAGTVEPVWSDAPGDGWVYEETRGTPDRLTLVGGGHVALALSRVMAPLGFHITVLDDRAEVPTMQANTFAHEQRVIDYADVASHVPVGTRSYVCIMTFGHASDERVLAQLVGTSLRYLGMMGSPPKVAQVFGNLQRQGVPPHQLARVHAPIGEPIGSRTPPEIAISIAAQIIRLRRTRP